MEKILPVLYHTQRNNTLFPYSTCMTTSFAMAYSFFNLQFKEDDEVFRLLNSKEFIEYYLKNTKLNQSWLKRQFLRFRRLAGKITKYTYLNNLFDSMCFFTKWITFGKIKAEEKFMNFEEIKNEIDNNRPVIFTTNFTKSGHICLIVGYEELSQNYLCFHDPYGDYKNKYEGYEGQTRGANCLIEFDRFVNGLNNGEPYTGQGWKTKDGKILCVKFIN